MKKIFLSAFALFVLCIIGFAFTNMVFGGYRPFTRYPSPYEEYNTESIIFRGDYSDDEAWTVLNEFSYVTIHSAGVKTIIGRSETDRITINVENHNNKTFHAEAVYTGEALTLEFRPTNITFDSSNIKFGITDWLEDIFSGNTDIIVTVGFPAAIYEKIEVRQGSGVMQINDLYSRSYDVNIGSGKCEFSRPAMGGFTSDRFSLKLGSGNAVFSGMETDNFNIDIGSGNFTLDRLSGEGQINMGSGKGSIAFCDKSDYEDYEYNEPEHDLRMGSGNLTLYYPKDGGVIVNGSFGSGKIEIDAFDYKKTLNKSNNDVFKMGSEAVVLDADMGSGTVTIRDSSSYTAPEIISEFVAAAVPNDGTVMSSTRWESVITEVNIADVNVAEVQPGSESAETVGILEGGSIISGAESSGAETLPTEDSPAASTSQEAA